MSFMAQDVSVNNGSFFENSDSGQSRLVQVFSVTFHKTGLTRNNM